MYLELWKTKTKNGYLGVSKNRATPNHPSQKQPWLGIETKKSSVTKGGFRHPYISHYTSILSALYHLYIPIFVSESQIPLNLILSPWYSHICQLNPIKSHDSPLYPLIYPIINPHSPMRSFVFGWWSHEIMPFFRWKQSFSELIKHQDNSATVEAGSAGKFKYNHVTWRACRNYWGPRRLQKMCVFLGFSYDWVVVSNMINMYKNPSHWRTPSFFKMVKITNQMMLIGRFHGI